jgi:hypothetical protein
MPAPAFASVSTPWPAMRRPVSPSAWSGTLPLSRVREACAAAAETGDRRPGKLVLVPG